MAEPGKCPVDHSKMAAAAPPSACPMHTGGAAAGGPPAMPPGHPKGGDISACPMHSDNVEASSKSGKVYNVYMQEINPTNNMPANPNQKPAPGQSAPLSTHRQESSIPKGGVDGTWTYPSEQMFYNALVRKNKSDGVDEKDMSVVIAIHNNMNETTWKKLLEWEDMHKSEHDAGGPRLRRFTGKPHDLSLKAKVKSWFGFGYPFDRHDWFVTRGGEEVRYIIDYYYDNTRSSTSPQQVVDGMQGPIWVDVRPALDSPAAALDRLKRFPERMAAAFKRGYFYSDGLNPNARPKEIGAALDTSDRPAAAAGGVGAGGAAPAASKAMAAQEKLAAIDASCAEHLAAMQMAANDHIRRNASVALNYCMARQVCPEEAASFMSVLEAQKEGEGDVGAAGGAEEQAFMSMTQCVAGAMQGLYAAVGAEVGDEEAAEARA